LVQRIAFLEEAGLSVAAMSDMEDGDCSSIASARRNVERLLSRLQLDASLLIRLRQVHGAEIMDAAAIASAGKDCRPEADGVATCQPGLLLAIGVADCAPVLLFDPVNRVVAALHAGREGVRRNIASAGIRFLCDVFGCDPKRILAWIGPCAGVCCYEVSPEIALDWSNAGLPAQNRFLDIAGANRHQLENAGVIRHNIEVVPHCTVCGGGYFSYRAHKTLHRNLVLVML
jgi:YfiH family protein